MEKELATRLAEIERLLTLVSKTDWHWDSDPIKGDPLERWRFRVCTVGRTVTQMYYDSGDRMVESEMKLICAMKNALPDLLAALRSSERWIPVSERLPEHGFEVLVRVDDDGNCHTGIDAYERSAWANFGQIVTHWMELPSAPTGGAGGG